MKQICAVSDLHLFCKRSEAHRHTAALDRAIAEAEVCVLNGDIFDFRWSVFDSVEETVDEALSWLDRIIARHPHCDFHYIFGNHDSVKVFIDALDAYAASTERLTCHHDLFRLNASVFLHGDVADRKMTPAEFEAARRVWHYDRQRGRIVSRAYDLAVWLGAHRTIPRLVFPLPVVAGRLVHYLEHVGHGRDSGVTDVYYGHTHVAVRDFQYQGLNFHNSGAPMPKLGFTILRATA